MSLGSWTPGESTPGQAGRLRSLLQDVAGAITPAGSLAQRVLLRAVAGAVASAGAVSRLVIRSLEAAVALAGAPAKLTSRALAATVALTGEIVSALRVVFSDLSGTVGTAGTLIRSTARDLAASVPLSGVLTKAIVLRLLSGAVALVGDLYKQAQKTLMATVASSGLLDGDNIFARTLTGAVASAGTISRVMARSLAGAAPLAGALVKQTYRALSAVMSITGAIQTYGPDDIGVYINGTDRRRLLLKFRSSIERGLYATPSTATLVFKGNGWTPVNGQSVTVQQGVHHYFSGQIVNVRIERWRNTQLFPRYVCECVDTQRKFNARLVNRGWAATSATTVITQAVAAYASGYNTTYVQAAMATIDLPNKMETMAQLMDRVMNAVGGVWYLKGTEVHAYIGSESGGTVPDTLDSSNTSFRQFTYDADIEQIRTRVYVEGLGTTCRVPVTAGATLIPVVDASMFNVGTGKAITPDAQILSYTNKAAGGAAAVVTGTVSGPGSAPLAAVDATTVGQLAGVYYWKVAYGNSLGGETVPSSASASATGVAFSTPGVGSVSATSSVIGVLVGAFVYVVTFVNSLGETTQGTSFGRTATAVAAPGAATVSAGSTIGRFIAATYRYRLAFRTEYGLTEGGTVFSRTASSTATPSAPSVAAVSSTIGKLIGAYGYKTVTGSLYGESAASLAGSRTASAQSGPGGCLHTANAIGPLKGNYSWKTSYVNADGHEVLGSASSTFTHTGSVATAPSISGSGTTNRIRIRVAWIHPVYGESVWSDATEDIDHGSTVTVTATGLPSGCSWVIFSTGSFVGSYAGQPYYRMPQIYTGSSGNVGQNGIEATSAAGTMGGNGVLSSIGTGPTGTVKRRIFRTKAGGGIHYLVGEIPNNTDTTFTDTVPDDALGQREGTNLLGEQHTVSSIATGPTGTTYRDIYRTEAGGGTYYFLRRIGDNSTTSFVDNAPDTELDKGRTAPGTATSGDSHVITGIPAGPTGTLSRLIYREDADGSGIYRLLGEIPGNVTSTYTDEKWAASELGAETARTTSTAGGESHSLVSIPSGPTGTLARRIYRLHTSVTNGYQFVGELGDNVTSTFIDNLRDAELGSYVPLTSTAGANRFVVTIPTGGTGVTRRLLFRTAAGGSEFKLVRTIDNNSDTTFTDDVPDTSLGRPPVTISTIGANAGDTSLGLSLVTSFPSAGWVETDIGLISYTGISSTTLTGIPASGVGSITAALQGGSPVVCSPMLTGVTWPSASANLADGSDLNLLVQSDDVAAQTALAAVEGGDGIYEHYIQDRRYNIDGATDRGLAELEIGSSAIENIGFITTDPKVMPGRPVPITAINDYTGSPMIQSTRIFWEPNRGSETQFAVACSSRTFNLYQVLRQLQQKADRAKAS